MSHSIITLLEVSFGFVHGIQRTAKEKKEERGKALFYPEDMGSGDRLA